MKLEQDRLWTGWFSILKEHLVGPYVDVMVYFSSSKKKLLLFLNVMFYQHDGSRWGMQWYECKAMQCVLLYIAKNWWGRILILYIRCWTSLLVIEVLNIYGLPTNFIFKPYHTVTVFFVLDVFFKNHFHISCIPLFSPFKSRHPRFSLYSMV